MVSGCLKLHNILSTIKPTEELQTVCFSIVVNIWGKICMKLKDVVETKPEMEEEHYERVGESLKVNI